MVKKKDKYGRRLHNADWNLIYFSESIFNKVGENAIHNERKEEGT